MMNRFFALLAVAAILCGICTGRADALTNVVLEEGAGAIELCIYLTGSMCVWGGLLRIAQRSGLTDRLAACFAKPACWLFPGLNPKGTALPAITMNFAANLLGLGNAATPFGLTAVAALKKESGCGSIASDNIVLFTVLNTASLTLFPTTVAALRAKHGSAAPLSILPWVWLTSAVTLIVLIVITRTLSAIQACSRRKERKCS